MKPTLSDPIFPKFIGSFISHSILEQFTFEKWTRLEHFLEHTLEEMTLQYISHSTTTKPRHRLLNVQYVHCV